MEIEIVSRETIKPSSPTPITLRSFKLSVLDQLALPIYTSIVLFYQEAAVVAEKLKKSLSETLTHFYPLAGRINDNISVVECNDDGAVYIEARVHGVLLSDLLQQPNLGVGGVKQFVPIGRYDSSKSVTWPLLVVQASFFHCGGLAISVSMSHKLADASTVSTFIRAWASLSRHEKLTPPHFDTTAFRFSGTEGRDISVHKPRLGKVEKEVDNNNATPTSSTDAFVRNRFVFDASKMVSLKAKAAGETVPQPTRFEAVTALIWRCAIGAFTRSNSDLSHHALDFAMNLRKRVEPPLPENSFGNFASSIIVQAKGDSLNDSVAELRKGIKEFCESKVKKFGSGDPDAAFGVVSEYLKEVADMSRRSKEINLLTCVNWCNFQFYEADFGWNKPSWVCMAGDPPLRIVKLIDTIDGGGVEAWVTLTQQEMAIFESDPQLLLFASSNPSICSLNN